MVAGGGRHILRGCGHRLVSNTPWLALHSYIYDITKWTRRFIEEKETSRGHEIETKMSWRVPRELERYVGGGER